MTNTYSANKYHQAAFVYIINAVTFFVTYTMGTHDFGQWNYILYTAGSAMILFFPVLIYKGYRGFTMFLAVLYGIRSVVSLFQVPFFTDLIIFGLVLQIVTCYMLTRAVWDLGFGIRNVTES